MERIFLHLMSLRPAGRRLSGIIPAGLRTFLRNWTLPIAMLAGAGAYFLFVSIPGHQRLTPAVSAAVAVVQPLLIFLMLFVTFCKTDLSQLHFRRWHLWLVLVQVCAFAALALASTFVDDPNLRAILESGALCMICPTATAAVVITGKLGGNMQSLITYTLIANLATAVAVPVIVPLCHPQAGMDFMMSLWLILAKVFPLLIMPLIAAIFVKRFIPALARWFFRYPDLAFYLWAVSLALAIAVTVKSIVHSHTAVWCEAAIGGISLVCCLVQFWLGRRLGAAYADTISAGQALGQKNTVFAIWMGFTFLTPVTAVAGGFYSVWHNVINSLQLYRKQKSGQ